MGNFLFSHDYNNLKNETIVQIWINVRMSGTCLFRHVIVFDR